MIRVAMEDEFPAIRRIGVTILASPPSAEGRIVSACLLTVLRNRKRYAAEQAANMATLPTGVTGNESKTGEAGANGKLRISNAVKLANWVGARFAFLVGRGHVSTPCRH
jgi:hypothetical protein